MNWKLWTLLIIAGSATAAEESTLKVPGQLPTLDYRGMKLVSSFQSISHALRTLDRGFPQLGLAADAKVPEPNKNSEYGAMMADLDKQLSEPKLAFAKNFEESLAEEEKVAQFRTDLISGKLSAPTPKSVKPMKVRTEAVVALDLEKFKACATKALPALYAKLAYQQAGDGYGAMTAAAVLDPERGNGKQIHASALACGRYLGALGLVPESPVEEIKILTALREGQDRKELLWQLFVIRSATSKELRLPDPLFWQYAWKEASFRAVFRKQDKLTLESLLEGYLEYAKQAPTMLVGNLHGLEERVQTILERLP